MDPHWQRLRCAFSYEAMKSTNALIRAFALRAWFLLYLIDEM